MFQALQRGSRLWYSLREAWLRGSNVLIVDDFMKAGGTINGMVSLLDEFKATVAGIAVLVESEHTEECLVEDYVSLIKLTQVVERDKKIKVSRGNYFTK